MTSQNNLVLFCRFKAHSLEFSWLCMIWNFCFLGKYGLWKLQLELWNMSHKLLNRTLLKKKTCLTHTRKKLFSLFSIHFLLLLYLLLLKQARKGCRCMNTCARWKSPNLNMELFEIKDHLQVLVLILSKFQQINQVLVLLKSSENCRFSGNFMGNRS